MNSTNKFESPQELRIKFQGSLKATQNLASNRQTIRNILDHKDSRILIIVGPCSFHDPKACFEYAQKLKLLADEVADKFFLVMRVYTEKPRTRLGWKGYISDPFLNNTNCIQEGILNVRRFMIDLCELNVPIATEILSPIAHLYYEDLLSWASIGARTVESQTHREIASNLTMPVGFKNNTNGDITSAINGILFASRKHSFIGVNNDGNICAVKAKGNPYAHLVLRGSQDGPNYSKENIDHVQNMLASMDVSKNIIVDCSHGNSSKNYLNQEIVFNDVLSQKINGDNAIVGTMIESFLMAENQAIPSDLNNLKYGCSVTDGCLSWESTEMLIKKAHKKLRAAVHNLKPRGLNRPETSLSQSELILK